MGRPSNVVDTFEPLYFDRLTKPSDINQLLPVLRAYAEDCRRVTEFGVRGGNSTMAFLAARPAFLRCYDINPCEAAIKFLKPHAEILGIKFTFHQISTLDVEITETDLLFIDTLHTADQLLAELRRHSENSKKWIMVHDTETNREIGEDGGAGLKLAINTWLEEGDGKKWVDHTRIPFNNGLTIFRRRP